jgi:hypothetical protein
VMLNPAPIASYVVLKRVRQLHATTQQAPAMGGAFNENPMMSLTTFRLDQGVSEPD